jgi:hypothetical protein
MAIVRVMLALVWLIWAVLTWWSSHRQADRAQFEADFGAGRITSFTAADSWQRPSLWAAPTNLRHNGGGTMLVWKTSSGQTFYLEPQMSTSSDPWLRPGQPADLVERLERADVPRGGQGVLNDITAALGLLMIVLGLGILLGATNPARGTRWFWFWVGQLPLGFGYLAWLAWERPWSEPKTPIEKRNSGWVGLGCLLLGVLVLGIPLSVAQRVLGTRLVPGSF